MLNLNVGILGHVDSGKTSLAKVLSQVASTACFDKNPQSQARGITIDLGFSSFVIDTPDHLKERVNDEKLQFTLVDCPGHASLIRTIIGGAQIIDFMLLVIDATKGIQTQTAECLVIGELTCDKLIVVLNKIDLIDEPKRNGSLEKMVKRLKNVLRDTKFKDAKFVSVSACPGSTVETEPLGINVLIEEMASIAFLPHRDTELPFLFAVDHCFAIKGQGTVLTGTILQGKICEKDDIEIPLMKTTRKIKSMQMFKKPVKSAVQGDRLGICVTQFDASQMERGIVASPGLAITVTSAIVDVNKIKYFKGDIKSKSKFHVSIGYETMLSTLMIFSTTETNDRFDFKTEYVFEEMIDELDDNKKYFALLEFNKPVISVPNSLVLGSRLDMDIHSSACRLAFWGHLNESTGDKEYSKTFLQRVNICKNKRKVGIVERIVNKNEIIVKKLFKKETNITVFVGLTVSLSSGEIGKIEGSFGQSGKVKVFLPESLKEETYERLQRKKSEMGESKEPVTVLLEFKKYIYDPAKKIIQ